MEISSQPKARFALFCLLVPTTKKDQAIELNGSQYTAPILSSEYHEVFSMVKTKRGAPFRIYKYKKDSYQNKEMDIKKNLSTFPFPGNKFDLIVCYDFLDAIADLYENRNRQSVLIQLLSDMQRHLADGGKLILGVENLLDYGRLNPKYISIKKMKDWARIHRKRSLTLWGYKKFVKAAGFSRSKFHLAVPSHLLPKETCSVDPGSLKEFYKGVYPKPKNHLGNFLLNIMIFFGIAHFFAPAFIIEAER